MAKMADLNIKSGGNTVQYFFKNELEKEFVGLIYDGQDLNFSYTLRLPALINGLGYKNGNYFLRHFYPQLAIQNNEWDFEGVRHYVPKRYAKASFNVSLKKVSDLVLYTNGLVSDQDEFYSIKAENIGAFYLNLIELNSPFKKFEGSFVSGDRKIPYTILNFAKHQDSIWAYADIKINTVTTKLNRYLGNYPHEHLYIIITEDCNDCFVNENFIIENNYEGKDASKLESYFMSTLVPLWVSNNFNICNDENYWLESGLTQFFKYKLYSNSTLKEGSKKNDEFPQKTDQAVHEFRYHKTLMPLMTEDTRLSSKQFYLNRFVQSRDFLRYAEN